MSRKEPAFEWKWRCAPVPEPILGPRDWSPRVKAAVRDLRRKEAMLPEYMRLTKQELAAAPPMLKQAIEDRTAFVAKVGGAHHIVFVGPSGLLLMTEQMKDIFHVLEFMM